MTEETGAGTRTFVDCPGPDACIVPADIHRHFVGYEGPYFLVKAGTECDVCGRKWFAFNETLLGDTCLDCVAAGRWLDAPARLIYPTYPRSYPRPAPPMVRLTGGCYWANGFMVHRTLVCQCVRRPSR